MAHYRIVRDSYTGYEVQWWRWWLPFWTQPRINTHPTIADAESWAREYAKTGGVKYLGRLP